jgi:SHS2 domain-containing protein
MSYLFIDHTADVAADLSGGSLGELFASGAQALTDTITDRTLVGRSQSIEVALDAASLEELLVDWLNELLYHFEVRNFLVADAEVTVTRARDGLFHLAGTAQGEPFDAARHPQRLVVKSATYHGLKITEPDGEWKARIVLDI